MPILNYTTTINVEKTMNEIQKKLVTAGARSIMIDYDGAKEPTAVIFVLMIKDQPINFRLASNDDGILRLMNNDKKVPRKLKTAAQARRVAWRIIKDWVEAQLALVECNQASIEEVFLHRAITSNGQTVYQRFQNDKLFLLEG